MVLYLTGVLMNISRLDAASCVEIGQLGGVEVLVQMIGVSREKQIVYCLECLRACCKQDASCKVGVWSGPDPIGKNGDMWRHHPPNQLSLVVEQPGGSLGRQLGVRGAEQPPRQHPPVLPRQRLDALMQIEENWSKKCACAAAKVLSNLLCSECGVWV